MRKWRALLRHNKAYVPAILPGQMTRSGQTHPPPQRCTAPLDKISPSTDDTTALLKWAHEDNNPDLVLAPSYLRDDLSPMPFALPPEKPTASHSLVSRGFSAHDLDII